VKINSPNIWPKTLIERTEKFYEQFDQYVGIRPAAQRLNIHEDHFAAVRFEALNLSEQRRLPDAATAEHELVPSRRGLLEDSGPGRNEPLSRALIGARGLLQCRKKRHNLLIGKRLWDPHFGTSLRASGNEHSGRPSHLMSFSRARPRTRGHVTLAT
jgi:hypothetical protein